MGDLVVWCTRGQEHFGRIASRALRAPLLIDAPVGDCESVYVVGMVDPPFYAYTLASTSRARRRILHWCGWDVLNLMESARVPRAESVCESEGLREELRARGVDARVVPLPTAFHFDVTPFAQEPVVATYGGVSPDIYGGSVATAAYECFGGQLKFLSYVKGQFDAEEMRQAVARSWVYLRTCPHDGGALGAKEYMEAGRRAIVSIDMPYARKVRFDDLPAVVEAINEAISHREPDYEAAAYWREQNSDERFRAQIKEVL